MFGSLTRRLARWNGHFINRWPMAVLAGLTVILPVCLVLSLLGGIAAYVAPLQQARSSALELMPRQLAPEYLSALREIQRDCYQPDASDRSACSLSNSAVDEAARRMGALTKAAGLSNCQRTPIRQRYPFDSDLLTCQAPNRPGTGLLFLWTLLGVCSVVATIALAAYVSVQRALVPSYSNQLWTTPYLILAVSLLLAPAVISTAFFWLRVNGASRENIGSAAVSLVWVYAGAALVASWGAVDLRTFRTARLYPAGLIAVVAYALALTLLLILVTPFFVGRGSLVSGAGALCVAGGLWLSFRFLCQLPKSRYVMKATVGFLWRFLFVVWPTAALLLVLALEEQRRRDILHISFAWLIAGLVTVNLLWSRLAEVTIVSISSYKRRPGADEESSVVQM